jgi:hypothetical protein
MADPMTAEDLLPLVARLSPQERARFLRLMTASANDAKAYAALPPKTDEFTTNEDELAWDADGWENVG